MLTSVLERWTRWRTYLRVRNELLQHNNRELFDLGIGPGDVDHVARAAAMDTAGR